MCVIVVQLLLNIGSLEVHQSLLEGGTCEDTGLYHLVTCLLFDHCPTWSSLICVVISLRAQLMLCLMVDHMIEPTMCVREWVQLLVVMMIAPDCLLFDHRWRAND